MESTLFQYVIQAVILFITGGGFVALLHSRKQARQIASNTHLTESQIEISLSGEARAIIATYRVEFKRLEDKVEKADKKADRAEAQTDFLVSFLRNQGIPIPEYPLEIRHV